MDRQLSAYLNGREPQVATDIDVITAAVAVPLLEIDGEDHVLFTGVVRPYVDSLVKLVFLVDIESTDKTGAAAAIRECSEERDRYRAN